MHAPTRSTISAIGWLEPASAIVRVAAPATVEASRVARLLVKEGDWVEAGQVLAVLDTAAKLEAQKEMIEAQLALRQALLERARLDAASNTAARRSAVARARADLLQAQLELTRQQTLAGKDIASASILEKRTRDFEIAKAQLEETQAAQRRIEATLSGGSGNAGQIDVAVAERELVVAKADLAHATINLDQASIRAPIPGRVLTILARAGERISPDGLLELGSTDRMVSIVEVYQSDAALVRLGVTVELRSDALSAPLHGVVERIGLKVKRQSVVNNDPATDTDARVVEIRVSLDQASSQQAATLSRLQIRATLRTGAP